MRLLSVPDPTEAALHIKAACQQYEQTGKLDYLGGAVSAGANASIEVSRRIISAEWVRIRNYGSEIAINPTLSLKARLLEAEVVEALMHGCAT